MSAVCVAEAFAPDDTTNETTVTAMAAALGLPSCASTDLSGLYGLELRAVTAAINASILPIAVRTAAYVEDGVERAGVHAPVMVMRGDGGATDLDGFRRAPARTLYSGPSASVAGALRHTGITDGVIVEVGGTSTNVAAIRYGRPALSYVQVASHATALRSLDVRVVGVAGGSMLRARRGKVYGVGPRSAHIAGLAYACFTDPAPRRGRQGRADRSPPGRPGRLPRRAHPGRRAAGDHQHLCRQRPGHHPAERLLLRRARGGPRRVWPPPVSCCTSTATRWPGGCWRPRGRRRRAGPDRGQGQQAPQPRGRRGRRRRGRARPPRRRPAGLAVRGARRPPR